MNLLANLKELDPAGSSVYSELFAAMDLVGICEGVIDWGMQTYPAKREMIFNMFTPLGTLASQLGQYAPRLFEPACREIITRIGEGLHKKDDLQAGTYAECLIAFCEASLVHPLSEDGVYCYYETWIKVFGEPPESFQEAGVTFRPYASYKDMYELEIARLRKQIANARRIEYPDEKDLKPVPAFRLQEMKSRQLSFL